MANAAQYVRQHAKAERLAKRKYPTQPERARRMRDSIMAEWNGPYRLEPLTLIQHIIKIFEPDHFDD